MSVETGPRGVEPTSALVVGLVVLGVALLVANVPGSPLRSTELELVVLLALPVAVAVLAYVRGAPAVAWWEVAALTVWGGFGVVATAFVGFFAAMDGGGSYPGPWAELGRNLGQFLATTVGLGGPYALAGRLRADRPWASVVCVGLAVVVLAVLSLTVVVAL